jgi:hypothetical protein
MVGQNGRRRGEGVAKTKFRLASIPWMQHVLRGSRGSLILGGAVRTFPTHHCHHHPPPLHWTNPLSNLFPILDKRNIYSQSTISQRNIRTYPPGLRQLDHSSPRCCGQLATPLTSTQHTLSSPATTTQHTYPFERHFYLHAS